MTPARWQRIKQVFQTASDCSPEDRAAYLASETAGDLALRAEVERMLRHSSGSGPLDLPAWEGLRIEPRFPPGAFLGPYEILSEAGAGGMGRVYQARDTRLGRIVAIKVLNAEFSDRLRDEGRAISSLNHPHVCALYDIGEQDGASYLVMEYVEGESLAAILARGPLPLDAVSQYGIEIAGALAAAHLQGIVHRDLKPANIMIAVSGVNPGVKVLDFGIARIDSNDEVSSCEVAGTAAYMSPSRWNGVPADARSDVFALGMILYEMAAGKCAPGLGFLSQLPPTLATLIDSCLCEDGAARVQRMEDVQSALRRFQSELASPQSVTAPKRAAIVWTAATLTLAAALGLALWKPSPVPTAVSAPIGSSDLPIPQRQPEPLPQKVEATTPVPPPTLATLASYSGQHRDPAFSPDGSRLAFSWAHGSPHDYKVYVKNLRNGDAPRPLTEDSGHEWGSAWSPDGRRIAFEHRALGFSLVWALSEGGRAHLVAQLGEQPEDTLPQVSWSHDGQWIAAPARDSTGATQITLFNANTGERRQLTSKSGSAHAPAFSPDGKSLAYASCEASNFPCDVEVIALTRNLAPLAETQITGRTLYIRGIAWLPNSRALVYSEGSGRNSMHSTLWRVSTNPPGEPLRIDLAGADARHPAIPATGGRLAFTRISGWSLMVINDFR